MNGHYICDCCGYDGGEHAAGCRNYQPIGKPFLRGDDRDENGNLTTLKEHRRPPALPDGEAVAWREALIHTICPHIKRWSDGDDVPETPCKNCPVKVQTSQGEGVQMCRLNAEHAADEILALYALASGEKSKA